MTYGPCPDIAPLPNVVAVLQATGRKDGWIANGVARLARGGLIRSNGKTKADGAMKILIGDDHLLFREGLRRLLEQLHGDAIFVEAGTFDEVLQQCRVGGGFDVVLMDLHMPNWPGFDGLREVQSLQPGVPVVVISASEALNDIRGALDHGATGYIPKSSSVKVMMGALNLVFSGGIYVPPGDRKSVV